MNIFAQSDPAPETAVVLSLADARENPPIKCSQPEVRDLEIAVVKSLQKIAAYPFDGSPFAFGRSVDRPG